MKGKKFAVIDSGTMISLSSTCFINVFRRFVAENGIDLVVSKGITEESVWAPIENKRYSLSAVRIKKALGDGTLDVVPQSPEIKSKTKKILELANSLFIHGTKKKPIKIIQEGEAEALALAHIFGAKIMFVDERTVRALIENPLRLKQILERKQKTRISLDRKKLEEINYFFKGIKVFRSVDLLALSYEQGLFDGELESGKLELEAALYAIKYAGCAVSGNEIQEYVNGVKPPK